MSALDPKGVEAVKARISHHHFTNRLSDALAAVSAYLEATAPSGQAPLEGVNGTQEMLERSHFGYSMERLLGEAPVSTRKAFEDLLAAYVKLSGARNDGFWNADAEPVVINARSALLPASAEPVAWRYHWKDVCGNWSEWIVCTVDPRDWTWPPTWKDFDAEPLYASPPANGAVELPELNGTTEVTPAVGVSTQTGEAVPANLPTAGSKTPASGAVEAGWQTMDSAPKDGTRILLGNCFSKAEHWPQVGYVMPDGVYRQNGLRYPEKGKTGSPTHWMHRPVAPPPALASLPQSSAPDRGEG